MKKSILAVAILMFAASVFMYVSGSQGGQAQLQAAPVTPQELKTAEQPENPYVIRNGSNELPPGIQGEDPNKKWMPAWQKDAILDAKGVPMVGSPQEMFGKNPDGTMAKGIPESSSSNGSGNTSQGNSSSQNSSSQASSASQSSASSGNGGGITPDIPSDAGDPSAPDAEGTPVSPAP